MIAFDRTLLENTFFVAGAKGFKNGDFLTAEQLLTVKSRFPTLRTQNNILIRIGFFLLGSLLYSSIVGMGSLFTLPILEQNYEAMIFVYAIIGLATTEFLAIQNYYGYGLDDAFILGFQSMLYVGIGVTTEDALPVFITMGIVGAMSCIRYVHTLSALVSLVGITGTIGFLVLDYHIINPFYLSFVLLFFAVALYFIHGKLDANPKSYYYKKALQLLQVFSLFLAYASVNYFMVREVSEQFIQVQFTQFVVAENGDIPLAWLFYTLTFGIPCFYIGYALKIKNRSMFLIGLLTLALAFATIRYYYSLIPLENALILGGVVLFGIAYLAIGKIRHNESGITFRPDRNTDSNALQHAQALIINSQLSVKVETPSSDMPFGGGGFSGGGAGESY